MSEIKYETNEGVDDCVFEVADDQAESCIMAELETAKREFEKKNINYDEGVYIDKEGRLCTEIWEVGGDRYIRWTRKEKRIMERHLDVYVTLNGDEYTVEIHDSESSDHTAKSGWFTPNEPHPEFDDWVGGEIYSWLELMNEEESDNVD